MKNIQLYETVAIIRAIERNRLTLVAPEFLSIESLPIGQVGTIVEIYSCEGEKKYLIEFADGKGREYAMAILKEEEFLVLHYELEVA